MNKRITLTLFLVILVLSVAVKFYKFTNPIADWHAWRQADTSSVSRTFVEEGIDLLHPRYHDLSNVPSGKDNPQGYRFVEFPIYNFFQAILYKSLRLFTLEEWGRLITIFSSTVSAVFIFLIVQKRQSRLAALIASFFFCFLPFNVYFGRTILPDPSMVAASLGGIYFFDLWASKKSIIYYLLSIILVALALLLKPFALFFFLPIIYIAYEGFGLSFLKNWRLYLFAGLSITPLILWRLWMMQYPEGIPFTGWLFNFPPIRFKGAFFYWLFADRIARLILGFWGIVIFAFGFFVRSKNILFFLSFVLSSLIYLTVIASGNVRHDYYQILIVPTVAIFMGLGGEFLLSQAKSFGKRNEGIILFITSLTFSMIFGWYFVRDFYNINNPPLLRAGAAVDKLIPKDAKIVANLEGDTTLLYATKRKGWASYQSSMEDLIKMGADYMLIVNPKSFDYSYQKTYKVVESKPEFILFNLREVSK